MTASSIELQQWVRHNMPGLYERMKEAGNPLAALAILNAEAGTAVGASDLIEQTAPLLLVILKSKHEKTMNDQATSTHAAIAAAVTTAVDACHKASFDAGWWINPVTDEDSRDNPMCFSQKLCLIHSEISEAMEGDRKNLMDDKLPHRHMREVELADALIRICDLAGAYGMDLGGAVAEKMAYNTRREDHQIEARRAGGKAY